MPPSVQNSARVAKKYIADVLTGKATACKWVRLFCERHEKDIKKGTKRGLYFDEEEAERVLRFFDFLRHSKGEWGGQSFILSPWEQAYLWVLFGWRKKDGSRRFRISYLEVARKNGKALVLDTPINTPGGWRTMRDLEPGDLVFDDRGVPCHIVSTSDIFVGHDCYRVTFEDGEEIIADAGHLWTVMTKNSRRANNRECKKTTGVYRKKYREKGGYYDVTTAQMAKDFSRLRKDGKGTEYKYRVPMNAPVYYPEASLPLPPYAVGVWLGDGSKGTTDITSGAQDVQELISHLRDSGVENITSKEIRPGCYRVNIGAYGKNVFNPIRGALRNLGIFDAKRIPLPYLRASEEQRYELLQGLMDTDGYCDKRGMCEFVQKDTALIGDFSELLSSLGIKHNARKKTISCNGKACEAWSILFYCDRSKPCFKLRRKVDRLKASLAPRMRNKSIINIEPIKSVPTKCITVDSPSNLYLAGRKMTATHNSTLAAGVALYLLDADKEPGAEVYSAATKRDQAKIVHGEACRMVRASAMLKQFITVRTDNMFVLDTNSKFEPLSSDYNSLDGLNIHGAIVDEVHAHKTRDLWDILETATGARRQPLMFAITTAGVSRQGICRELHDYLEKVLEGSLEDDSFCGIIFTLDEEDDYTDERVWVKANPNLGVSVKLDDLRDKIRKAREAPAALNAFLRLHMNIWTQAETRWIDPDAWAACGEQTPLEDLRKEPCYAGLDLSSTTDISAFVLKFPRTGDALGWFWIPEDEMEKRERRDRVPFSAWVRHGYVEATPGNVIDYEYIRQRIKQVAAEFRGLREIGYDPWNATQLAIQLEEDGFNVVPVRQGFQTLSPAAKELEREIMSGELKHGGNPVLRWMASNVVLAIDPAENIKPDKAKSAERIDGIVALCMAISRQIQGEDDTSIYETRGLLTV